MRKTNDTFHDELSIGELDLVSGGVTAPNASAPSAGGSDVTADVRKSSGGKVAGLIYLVF